MTHPFGPAVDEFLARKREGIVLTLWMGDWMIGVDITTFDGGHIHSPQTITFKEN